MRAAIAALVVVAMGAAGCSGADGSTGSSTSDSSAASTPTVEGHAPLLVDKIDDAVAALETELGGPQRYFEINATPTLVNLFVAIDNDTKAVSYVYAAGSIEAPDAAQPASGPTFVASAIDFDPDTVMDQVVAQLPDSDFRRFSVLGDGGGVRYVVMIESEGGVTLDVSVGADGAILGMG